MAFRLKLVPDQTRIDFFRWQWLTFGVSALAMVASVLLVLVVGLNFGVDFRGGTSIRTESPTAFNVADYRGAIDGLGLGDVSITEVFDPSFGPDKHVAMIRLSAGDGQASISPEQIAALEGAVKSVDPQVRFTSVESVGPKVSGELIWTAIKAVAAATFGIMVYIWVRFEWQFALGAVVAIIHDVLLTIGVFALFQLRFDLTTIAALLTTLGYSVNDTVVVFDRLRENLIKYKSMPLVDVMNQTVNETLSRTVMTAVTTALALGAMLIFGGDVIRGFVFAMLFGVFIGTYSTLYVAKNIVLILGVDRGDKPKKTKGGEFANVDA